MSTIFQHTKSHKQHIQEQAIDSSFKMLKSQLLPEIFKFPLQLVNEQQTAKTEQQNAKIKMRFVLAYGR